MTRTMGSDPRAIFRVAVQHKVRLHKNPDFDRLDPESMPNHMSDETFMIYYGPYQTAAVARGILRQEYGRAGETWDVRRRRNGIQDAWIERCPIVGWEKL